MFKWLLAALGVVVLSISISALRMHLSDAASRSHWNAAIYRASLVNVQIDEGYERIPLVRLLAFPGLYDGRRVRVSGFVSLDFEDAGLHLDRAAYEAGLYANAIWVDRPMWLSLNDTHRLTHRYEEIAGTFHASQHGHMGLVSGTISEVRRIRPISGAADFNDWRLRMRQAVLIEQMLSGWFLTVVGWMALFALWMFRRSNVRG